MVSSTGGGWDWCSKWWSRMTGEAGLTPYICICFMAPVGHPAWWMMHQPIFLHSPPCNCTFTGPGCFHFVIVAHGWLFGNYSWKEHNSPMLLCGLCLLLPINNYVALLQVLVELVIIQKPGSFFNHYFMIWFDLLSSYDLIYMEHSGWPKIMWHQCCSLLRPH